MRVMIFGVFDNFHEGHRFFIEEALRQAQGNNNLVIVVARDATVRELKNKSPMWDESQRIATLQRAYPDATVVLGDEKQGSYDVIRAHKPDCICLGYDQHVLGADVRKTMEGGMLPLIPIHELQKLQK